MFGAKWLSFCSDENRAGNQLREPCSGTASGAFYSHKLMQGNVYDHAGAVWKTSQESCSAAVSKIIVGTIFVPNSYTHVSHLAWLQNSVISGHRTGQGVFLNTALHSGQTQQEGYDPIRCENNSKTGDGKLRSGLGKAIPIIAFNAVDEKVSHVEKTVGCKRDHRKQTVTQCVCT